jgi:putative ABC transport system permease protein
MMRATPGYFEALGMRLLQGRAFSTRDGPSARGVVVNDVLVRKYFPNTDPIGKRIKVTDDEWREIIGVVRGMMEIGATRGIGPQVYVPFVPRFGSNFCFIVRTDGNSSAWHSTLKQQVYAVDREQASQVMTLEQDIWETGVKSIFEFHLLSAFSIVALVIALVGIYGVVAYAVSQRKREIGIRMALGALPGDVASLVLKQGARLVAAGLGLGLLGALASGRLLESRLYQVSATDPLTLGAVATFFAAIAALACWIPARRAAKVDPIVALRAE